MTTHSRETYQPTSIMRWVGIFNGSSETGNYLASGFMSSNQLGVGATPMAARGRRVPVAPAARGVRNVVKDPSTLCHKPSTYGYGSIPIHTIFSGMNIHLPAILMFTRGTRFWHTAIWLVYGCFTLITHCLWSAEWLSPLHFCKATSIDVDHVVSILPFEPRVDACRIGTWYARVEGWAGFKQEPWRETLKQSETLLGPRFDVEPQQQFILRGGVTIDELCQALCGKSSPGRWYMLISFA